MIFKFPPPHLGQRCRSTSNTRLNSCAQSIRCARARNGWLTSITCPPANRVRPERAGQCGFADAARRSAEGGQHCLNLGKAAVTKRRTANRHGPTTPIRTYQRNEPASGRVALQAEVTPLLPSVAGPGDLDEDAGRTRANLPQPAQMCSTLAQQTTALACCRSPAIRTADRISLAYPGC